MNLARPHRFQGSSSTAQDPLTILQDAFISNARDVLLMVQNDRSLAESLRHFLVAKRTEVFAEACDDEEEVTTQETDKDAGVEFAELLEEFHRYATGKTEMTV